MRVNYKELGHVSAQWTSCFEGILLLKHGGEAKKKKAASFSEHWCRLKGNILVLCKTSERTCTEVEGIVILERFALSPTYEEGMLHAFRLDFDAGDTSLIFVARSEAEASVWRQHLNSAQLSPTLHRIEQIREELRSVTGTDPLDFPNASSPVSGEVSPVDDAVGIFNLGGVELSIGCENLSADIGPSRPNAQIVVFVRMSLEDAWTRVGTTEAIESNNNPKFLQTVCVRADRLSDTSHIRFEIFDLRDMKSELGIQIGTVTTTLDQLLPGRTSKLPICDPSTGLVLRGPIEDGTKPMLLVDVQKQKPSVDDDMAITNNLYDLALVCESLLSKRYFFNHTRGQRLHVVEFMGESKLCFDFSVEYLKSLIPREHLLYESLSRTGSCNPRIESLRKERLITMKQTLQQYEACLRNLVDCSGTRFKPCWERNNPRFDFVPTNLHVNQISVTDPDGIIVSSLKITTVGAFAAASRSLKSGGLYRTASIASKSATSYPPMKLSIGSSCALSPIAAAVGLVNTTIAGRAQDLLYRGTGLLAALRRDLVGLVQRLGVRDQAVPLTDRMKRMLDSLHAVFTDSLLKEVHVSDTVDDSFRQLCKLLIVLDALDKLENAPPSIPPKYPASAARGSTNDRSKLLLDIEKAREQLTFTLDKAWDACAEILWNTLFAQFLSLIEGEWNVRSADSHQSVSNLIAEAERLCIGNVSSVNVDNALTALSLLFDSFSYRHHAALCQALTAALSALLASIPNWNHTQWEQASVCGILTQFEGLMSCFGSELGMSEDWAWAIDSLTNICVILHPIGSPSVKPSEKKDMGVSVSPLATMTGINECEVKIPWSVWMNAPTSIQSQGRLTLQFHPVAFLVGINEQQTIAEKLDKAGVQLAINNHGLASVETYFQRYTKHYGAPPRSPSGLDVCDLITNIRHALRPPVQKKPVDILNWASEITQALGGLRITSCKSAKDRTSMSVTLEQIRWLMNSQSMHESQFLSALECIRRTGLRMDNVFKNTGGRKYAFNRLQLLSFPRFYRPPIGTYAIGVRP